jgi:predicted RNase H-like HicB family nuclease
MPATYYPAIIDRSKSGFGVSFPDFPGCIAAGDNLNAAALNAEAALAMHVEEMVKDKDPLPEPSRFEDIDPVEGADDVANILVRVDAPAKVERVLISLDANLLRAIDSVAPNRSAWVADAARAALQRGLEAQPNPSVVLGSPVSSWPSTRSLGKVDSATETVVVGKTARVEILEESVVSHAGASPIKTLGRPRRKPKAALSE